MGLRLRFVCTRVLLVKEAQHILHSRELIPHRFIPPKTARII